MTADTNPLFLLPKGIGLQSDEKFHVASIIETHHGLPFFATNEIFDADRGVVFGEFQCPGG
ncbi:MAG: hypothetical protein KGZ70_05885 [Hydrogenophaga sp.]|uniref:hypothetical protein n=1 Tax=Hydrogenophaga sp. TaxID=1904254 RepID=UPI001BC178A9|nr:hypothetical protein [Hydrogenophaga sp.]MBS3911351.1 hypothetical protein [Hydrogenophaga sp.]MDP2165482.1 hypothetical protein [Hydrogenophaga sp.]